MKFKFLILFVFFCTCTAGASALSDSLRLKLERLDYVMERRDTYYMRHEHAIDSLRKQAEAVPATDLRARFDVIHKLYNAYRSFQNDSARVYADREKALAARIGDKQLAVIADYDDLFTYMSRGDFTSAVEVMGRADLTGVSDSLKAEFFVQVVRLYSDLSNFTSDKYEDKYARLSHAYSDTVMRYARPESYAAEFASNFRYGPWVKRAERIDTYDRMLRRDDIAPALRAMLYSMLGDLYIQDGQESRGLELKVESAILDICHATRETTSKHFLAYRLYEMGDIERAARYIHVALEDAENYNAPQRKAEIGRALSLIEASRFSTVNHERKLLWVILLIVIIFVVAVVWAFVYIRRQNAGLKASKRIIEEKNEQITDANRRLSELNRTLSDVNARLRESVRIKDEYIGYGFYLNAEYIARIEEIYKLVNRKVTVGQADDLKNMLRLSDVKKEKEKFLKDFDSIFLRLFPTFIEQYGELFPADDRGIEEAADGILTPEMRIFALIRLGVTDASNIARLLNYSVNTINTYKTKAKNRSTVPNAEFEERIMQIRSVK